MTSAAAVPLHELVSLRQLVDEHPEELLVEPLTVSFEGELRCFISAGDKTAVIAPLDGGWEGRQSVRLDRLFADPAETRWKPKSEAASRWNFDPTLDVETRAARAAYLAENELTNEPRRGIRAQPERRICGRDGCSNRLHPSNTAGICKSCQLTCPDCGGPKDRLVDACRKCRPVVVEPAPVAAADVRTCESCGKPLHKGATRDKCLVCQRVCKCGRPKNEDAANCVACASQLRRYRPPARSLIAPPSRAELPPAVAAPRATTAATAPGRPDPAPEPLTPKPEPPRPSPLTLEELPDYVAGLLDQLIELREKLVDQDACERRLRELDDQVRRLTTERDELQRKLDAYADVAARVQAAIRERGPR